MSPVGRHPKGEEKNDTDISLFISLHFEVFTMPYAFTSSAKTLIYII